MESYDLMILTHMKNKSELYIVRGVEVSEPILFSSALSKIIQYLDNPENKPIQSHNGIDIYFRTGNIFIFSFDIEEQRAMYKEAYENISWNPNWFVPRIGNFFERNGKYYFVWDYSDTTLDDISDATKNNDILYRWVVINPVIFWQADKVKNEVNDWLSK